MTKLCGNIPITSHDPSQYEVFFDSLDRAAIRKYEQRELPPVGNPNASCDFNLFFGFFFDGTRNNYNLCTENEGFSNVARLYDTYPGQAVPGVVKEELPLDGNEDYPHFFKVYIPGVGTPFPQVNDSGKGMDATFGAASALFGHERIVWALMQAINNLNRYFVGQELLDKGKIAALSKQLVITGWHLKKERWLTAREMEQGKQSTYDLLRAQLKLLHGSIKDFMHAPGEKPANMSKGEVGNIHLSAFGFSRGATKARCFSNWMQRLCQLDAELTDQPGQMTLGGFPVKFDFLGIFDTVASVGLASSTLLFDGHAEWADAETSLRVPMGMPCVHLVAAHEIRRSFPLDSIEMGAGAPPGGEEIMFPGVHSDVGGGYLPKEQGRGVSDKGSDMLSRIPLAVMYRKARLAGVPLKAEKAKPAAQLRMQVDPKLIADFNAYLATLGVEAGKPAPEKAYKSLLKDLYLPYIAWRLSWVDKQDDASLRAHFDNLQNASNTDVNDLLGGNVRLAEHLSYYKRWSSGEMEQIGKIRKAYYPPTLDPKVVKDWAEFKDIWPELEKGEQSSLLKPAASRLFQYYVHDSYAWFRLTGKEEPEILAMLEKMSHQDPNTLSEEEKGWVKLYVESGRKQVPKGVTGGQEPFSVGAGYLRYRKVYAGADNVLLTRRGFNAFDAQVA
ncbi:T6SS phospholipase effector Tle1-like catalytic domain-containing protein [Chromobacterium sphagni]|uniref:T6SS phospholipase effector Tle1-like catalytic domain-containing protein n=1 Tax=Chromobacterium sphagni TaxID=1903179 RepID=UPI000A4080CF|nr:DUF2235 domain-containing protein [Chromobacterium sphagni]